MGNDLRRQKSLPVQFKSAFLITFYFVIDFFPAASQIHPEQLAQTT